MSPQDALSASHHTPLDGSGVAPGGCPRISKGGSFLPRPHPRQSAHCSPCSQSNSDDVPRPHPARRLPIFPTFVPNAHQLFNSFLCVGSPSCASSHSRTTSSVLQWASHSTLVETSLISPQFARFSASSTIPPRPFVNHDQHTIPTLRFVFPSLTPPNFPISSPHLLVF